MLIVEPGLEAALPGFARRHQRLHENRQADLPAVVCRLRLSFRLERERQNRCLVASDLIARGGRACQRRGDAAGDRATSASRSRFRRASVASSTTTPALCLVKIGTVTPPLNRQPNRNSGSAS